MKTKFRPHGQKQKTNGQKLYETVKQAHVLASWDFLSDKTQAHWETQAKDHPIFSNPNRLKNNLHAKANRFSAL